MERKECYILLLESATDACSVALSNDNILIAEKYSSIPKAHSELMAPMIDDILKHNGLTAKDCTAVAISEGPGSYMGLRIASSLAKGFAFATGCKFIGVSTLSVIAWCAKDNNLITPEIDLVIPMIDAGRMEVYTATFDKNLNEVTPTHSQILDAQTYAEILKNNKILFTGNGAIKYKEYLLGTGETNPHIKHLLENALFKEQAPHASGLRMNAYRALKDGNTSDLAYFKPFYLKDFIPGKPKKLLI